MPFQAQCSSEVLRLTTVVTANKSNLCFEERAVGLSPLMLCFTSAALGCLFANVQRLEGRKS
jgi:hypothetical protein